MTNPDAITDALVTRLKANAPLTTALGGEHISAYADTEGRGLLQAAYEMTWPSVLIGWQETAPGVSETNQVWMHRFSVFIRPAVGKRYGEAVQLVLNALGDEVIVGTAAEEIRDRVARRITDENLIELCEISFNVPERNFN